MSAKIERTLALAERLLAGRISDAEAEELGRLLREDADALDAYIRFTDLHGTLATHPDLAAPRRVVTTQFAPAPRPAWLPWALAASVTLSLLASGLVGWWFLKAERPGMTVTEVAGDISWSAGRSSRFGLKPGDQLASGTVTVDGDEAAVGLEFADGTKLRLGGGSEALIVTGPQKRVLLNRGTIFGEVTPQPPGRPMQVKTATAEAQVLGTEFSVTALTGNTILNVEHGRVQFRRLADGQTIEVSARQTSSASLDAKTLLSSAVQLPVSTEWRMDFSRPPGVNWKGMRLPARGRDPARVRAIPCAAGRKPDGTLLLHHGMKAHGQEASGALVALAPRSVVRLRWRTEKPTFINLFLSTHKAGGSFGGNFEAKIPARAGVMDAEGWWRMEVPLSEFRAVGGFRPASKEGLEVFLLFINTGPNNAGLEVAEVAITESGS